MRPETWLSQIYRCLETLLAKCEIILSPMNFSGIFNNDRESAFDRIIIIIYGYFRHR